VLAYDYSCSLDDSFSWEDLLMQGYQLLQEISDARSVQTSNEVRFPTVNLKKVTLTVNRTMFGQYSVCVIALVALS
jgi:hypothetical protein